MKVYVANHAGIWIGGCSVVVAKDERRARELLTEELDEQGIIFDHDDELEELDLTKEQAVVLFNGDY